MPNLSRRTSIFDRGAWSNYAASTYKGDRFTSAEVEANTQNPPTFAGGDLYVYINNIRVGNLESLTYTISIETVGQYNMGDRNPKAFTQGKRMIAGSMVFSQYDRHAVLQGVFNLTKLGVRTLGDLWEHTNTVNAADQLITQQATILGASNLALGSQGTTIAPDASPGNASARTADAYNLRGLSVEALNAELYQQLRNTARLLAATKLVYTDQLPPFDMTLIGMEKSGRAARSAIFGIQFVQETAGWTQNDLGSSMGLSFVCRHVEPWSPVELDAAGNTFRVPSY